MRLGRRGRAMIVSFSQSHELTERHDHGRSWPRRAAVRLGLGLSAELWLGQARILAPMPGCGAVLPFEIIYLHDGRGFSLVVAGLVTGTVTGTAVLSAPLTGPVVD